MKYYPVIVLCDVFSKCFSQCYQHVECACVSCVLSRATPSLTCEHKSGSCQGDFFDTCSHGKSVCKTHFAECECESFDSESKKCDPTGKVNEERKAIGKLCQRNYIIYTS